MAKFASREEQRFSPISQKLIEAVSGPVREKPIAADLQEETTKVVQIRAKAEEVPKQAFEQSQNVEPMAETEGQLAEERLTVTMRYHVSAEEKEDTEEFIRRLSSAATAICRWRICPSAFGGRPRFTSPSRPPCARVR